MNRADHARTDGRAAISLRPLLPFVLAYTLASFVHFAHNAEFIDDYPNLPDWLTRGKVYAAWFGVAAIGFVGCLLIRARHAWAGLSVLAVYALLGFAGLDHYAAAPLAAHTRPMNITIWFEVATAFVLLAAIARSMMELRSQ